MGSFNIFYLDDRLGRRAGPSSTWKSCSISNIVHKNNRVTLVAGSKTLFSGMKKFSYLNGDGRTRSFGMSDTLQVFLVLIHPRRVSENCSARTTFKKSEDKIFAQCSDTVISR